MKHVAPLIVVLAIAGCAHHLPADECNGAVSSWNAISQQVADYRTYLQNFRETSEKVKPLPPNAKYLFTVKEDATMLRNITSQPHPSSQRFAAFPSVDLKVRDLSTDISLIAREIANHEFEDSNGTVVTDTDANGFSTVTVGFFEAKPGMSSHDVFQKRFGRLIDRFNNDYASGLKSMRDAYQSQCGGDPAEIRSADDL